MPRTRTKTPKVEAPAGTRMKLKWVISQNCTPAKQRLVVKGLGFTRLNQVIEREDTLLDSWHGGQGAASDPDSRRVSRERTSRRMRTKCGRPAGRRRRCRPGRGARKPSRPAKPGGARKQPARHGERSGSCSGDVRRSQTAHQHVWHHARDRKR